VRFLLDQNLSARLPSLLTDAGHDAVHVAELGLSRADDHTILDRAADEVVC
jgi:predicted nuclease of predicted toxin-antitoxin system